MLDKVKTVIALGYFDCVHTGHRKVLSEAKTLADSFGANFTVFTFEGNLKAYIEGEEGTFVYSDAERKELYLSLGADEVYFAPINYDFLSTGKLDFLDDLNNRFNICAYVCGEDYRFGKFAEGNVWYLQSYAERKGQKVKVVETVFTNGEKVSTSLIKRYLKTGEIDKANALLGSPYRIVGEVVKDRGVGKKIGFPTANVEIAKGRCEIKPGVYAGKVTAEGNEYLAVINFGSRPTFDLNKRVCEVHLIDFNGDLYGKKITVKFERFMRSVIKFLDTESLIRQIKKDVTEVKNGR